MTTLFPGPTGRHYVFPSVNIISSISLCMYSRRLEVVTVHVSQRQELGVGIPPRNLEDVVVGQRAQHHVAHGRQRIVEAHVLDVGHCATPLTKDFGCPG